MRSSDRSLAALGMDGVPALDPLSYPGRVVGEPALLCGSRLLELTPTAGPMGRWRVHEGPARASQSSRALRAVDDLLGELGETPIGQRHPVIAIGSNAAPGQMHYKLTRLGLPAHVPMTPLRVSGLGIGVSAHVALNGYVANSPFTDPGGVAEVVLTLLDDDQLRAVDGTEIPRYRRVLVSGAQYPMVLPSGEQLDAAYLYANPGGVLAGVDGKPLMPAAQTALLAELLDRSARLQQLFDSPQDWVTKTRADPELRATVKQIFRESGWVLPQEALLQNACSPGSHAITITCSSSVPSPGEEPP